MLLPPIFGQVREHSASAISRSRFAITAFNVVSALLQTPAGFLVDRDRPARSC